MTTNQQNRSSAEMTCDEHYREAERLLAGVSANPPERFTMEERALFASAAAVHAQLAAIAQQRLAVEAQKDAITWARTTLTPPETAVQS